jgi:hypothetical protein
VAFLKQSDSPELVELQMFWAENRIVPARKVPEQMLSRRGAAAPPVHSMASFGSAKEAGALLMKSQEHPLSGNATTLATAR